MANFNYRVIGKDGKEKKGSLEAESKEKAMAALKAEGNTVLALDVGGALSKNISFGGHKRKPKSSDFSVFCKQFYSLLKAGVAVVPALGMLAEQTEHKTLQAATMNVRDNVQKGDSLAAAMEKEEIFPNLLLKMVAAGEQSGNIESSLLRMSEQFEKDTKVKGQLKKAMMYPIIIMVVAVVVLIVMVVVVIPSFANMFAEMDSDLPFLTRALMSLSDFIKTKWYICIIIIAAIVFGIRYFKKTKTGIYFFAKLGVKLPVFGNLTVKTACARFSRTFSTMIASGMPMLEAMKITASTMDNVLFKDALNETAVQIQRGVALTQPLKKSGLFPNLILHMVAIGEETGNLEEMLINAADLYDEEVDAATQQVMALMEPMVIIVMAGIVCVILGAIYGPIITLYSSLDNV